MSVKEWSGIKWAWVFLRGAFGLLALSGLATVIVTGAAQGNGIQRLVLDEGTSAHLALAGQWYDLAIGLYMLVALLLFLNDPQAPRLVLKLVRFVRWLFTREGRAALLKSAQQEVGDKP